MGDRGLDTSIWASRSNGYGDSFTKPGDWKCPSCGFSNFQRRSECMKCSTSRASTPRSSSPAVIAPPQIVPLQSGNNNSSFGVTSSPAAPIAQTQSPALPEQGKGLADSYWAPRNHNGRVTQTHKPQVWIKKHTHDYSTMNREARANNSSAPRSTTPDLGLPYEVQHFILTMVQRILEESCYDFACRWIPGALNDRNWSCAEAVELCTWRDFLPTALPPSALVAVPGYSLHLGLKDAVKIRNSAVHRHLCDNIEIRRMAQQAENLMTMFRDVTRQGKFERLGAELTVWDRNSGGDQQAARMKLEQALQEISERPMDDMDWTPNAVSLQEITSGAEPPQDSGEGELMELD